TMDGKDQDLDLGSRLAQSLGNRQSVTAGHRNIHEHDVRCQVKRFFEGFLAIGSLGYDFKPLLAGPAALQALSDDWVVIRHQDSNLLFCRTHSNCRHVISPVRLVNIYSNCFGLIAYDLSVYRLTPTVFPL